MAQLEKKCLFQRVSKALYHPSRNEQGPGRTLGWLKKHVEHLLDMLVECLRLISRSCSCQIFCVIVLGPRGCLSSIFYHAALQLICLPIELHVEDYSESFLYLPGWSQLGQFIRQSRKIRDLGLNMLAGLQDQHIALPMAIIYYKERMLSTISKGQRQIKQSLRETSLKLLESSPISIKQDTLHPLSNMCEVLPTVEAHQKLSKEVFYQGLTTQAASAILYAISRLPEGKQVFSLYHTVATNSLGTVGHPHQVRIGTLLKWQFPDTSQGVALQTVETHDINCFSAAMDLVLVPLPVIPRAVGNSVGVQTPEQ